MLRCDKAQEEADKKQVAQTMTDTESDSDELNAEYSQYYLMLSSVGDFCLEFLCHVGHMKHQ